MFIIHVYRLHQELWVGVLLGAEFSKRTGVFFFVFIFLVYLVYMCTIYMCICVYTCVYVYMVYMCINDSVNCGWEVLLGAELFKKEGMLY
jgi:hypothetical protein